MQASSTLYFVRYQAAPLAHAGHSPECIGAYFNAWVKAPDVQRAVAIGTRELDLSGWRVTEIDAVLEAHREDCADDEYALEAFDRARHDGVALVQCEWLEPVAPRGPLDADGAGHGPPLCAG